MEKVALVVVGPTCSGKTTLGIELARLVGGEVISADSRQFYKFLDIGTAKPTEEEQAIVKHHLVDFIEPDVDYNVSRFEDDALIIAQKLFSENKIPVFVGGSGLYIQAIVDGLFTEIETDMEYRDYLMALREKFGNSHIHGILKEVDSVSAEKMLPQNWKRIMRALEVYHISGEPIWKFHESHKREIDIKFIQYGLEWDRKVLYENIDNRVEEMIEAGLVDEIKQIFKMGYSKSINSLNTVGYKELISFLEDEISLERAVELIKRNTRRYAKRQMTWFRKDDRINWLKVGSRKDILKSAAKIATEF
ncbi:MAG: tRNA (adenosine(37)-N6)-dimethylallyltransferase MiaA [Bacteroidetes bacterium]|nr:tRNA (adenosine(37)-N6)-dimethylallyltransferase MiaA [Bacteroidota bacterium]